MDTGEAGTTIAVGVAEVAAVAMGAAATTIGVVGEGVATGVAGAALFRTCLVALWLGGPSWEGACRLQSSTACLPACLQLHVIIADLCVLQPPTWVWRRRGRRGRLWGTRQVSSQAQVARHQVLPPLHCVSQQRHPGPPGGSFGCCRCRTSYLV